MGKPLLGVTDPREVVELAIFDGTVSHSLMLAIEALEDTARALNYRLPLVSASEASNQEARAKDLREHAQRVRILRESLLTLVCPERSSRVRMHR